MSNAVHRRRGSEFHATKAMNYHSRFGAREKTGVRQVSHRNMRLICLVLFIEYTNERTR